MEISIEWWTTCGGGLPGEVVLVHVVAGWGARIEDIHPHGTVGADTAFLQGEGHRQAVH